MSLFGDYKGSPESLDAKLTPEEHAVLEKLARKTVQLGMTVPAILALETVKPLNYIGSQTLVFFEPMVQAVFNLKDFDTFRIALEKRESVEIMLRKIEAFDAEALDREKEFKKWYKKEKKNWKWYQRYLGVFKPKLELPENIKKTRLENNTDDSQPDSKA